jgi:hypothetical protein
MSKPRTLDLKERFRDEIRTINEGLLQAGMVLS